MLAGTKECQIEASPRQQHLISYAKEIVEHVRKTVPFSSNYSRKESIQITDYGNKTPLGSLGVFQRIEIIDGARELSTSSIQMVLNTLRDIPFPRQDELSHLIEEEKKSTLSKKKKDKLESLLSEYFLFKSRISEKYGVGNCAEMAMVGYAYAKKNEEKCEIKAGIFDIRNADHCFLILSQNDEPSLNDPDAVICDPWAGTYFPASKHTDYLKGYGDVWEAQYYKDRWFDPEYILAPVVFMPVKFPSKTEINGKRKIIICAPRTDGEDTTDLAHRVISVSSLSPEKYKIAPARPIFARKTDGLFQKVRRFFNSIGDR